MKRLLIIPILHGGEEMGSLSEAFGELAESLIGSDERRQLQQAIAELWSRIEDFSTSVLAHTDPSRLLLYQDGLPVGGERGKEILQDGAGKGIRNHILLLDLIDRGARLMATEDADLLKREYHLYRDLINRFDPDSYDETLRTIAEETKKLTNERDRAIGREIAATLSDGEIGLLYIGAAHEVQRYLPSEIMWKTYRRGEEEALLAWLSGGD